jgi:hypothetical protein
LAGFGKGLHTLYSNRSKQAIKNLEKESDPKTLENKVDRSSSNIDDATAKVIDDEVETIEGQFIGAAPKGTPRVAGETGEPLRDVTPDSAVDDVIVEDKAAVNVAEAVGGGTPTKEEFADVINQTKATSTAGTIKSNLGFNLRRYASRYASYVAFKPSSVFDPFIKYSDTAKRIQKAFRYDQGRQVLGKQTTPDMQDFNEYYKETLGGYLLRFKESLEPIQLTYRGRLSDLVNKDLMRVIRGGKKSDNKNINDAAKEIRSVLDEVGFRLRDAGYIEGDIENYVPRIWDAQKIKNNKAAFADLLVKGNHATRKDVDNLVEDMLDKSNHLDQGASAGSSFFYKRVFKDLDDNAFEEFLDSDPSRLLANYLTVASKQLAKKDIFGVKNLQEFNRFIVGNIDAEMRAAGQKLSRRDREAMEKVYKESTGEGLDRYGKAVGALTEGLATINRMAYLPLATMSSLTEIMINIAKAGATPSLKGFSAAAKDGGERLTKQMQTMLKKQGLTESEIRKEMNEFGIALDVGLDDMVQRLSDEAMSSRFNQKVNNAFFQVTLLDQWTKLVQTSSFVTGKNLINTNLKEIKNHLDAGLTPSRRINRFIGELNELGVDYREGIKWLDKGGSRDDRFYHLLKRGAARYTNEVILNPSMESGLKPFLLSNPKTSIFFQFMGYPMAFNNVILKNAAKSLVQNPESLSNTARVMGAGLIMTETARALNYFRSDGRSERFKSDEEIYTDALLRWGGLGLLFDQVKRGKDRATIYQEPILYPTGFTGPVVSDAIMLAKTGDYTSYIGTKVPGYGAGSLLLGKDFMQDYKESLRELHRESKENLLFPREPRIRNFAEGGKVEEDPIRKLFAFGNIARAITKSAADELGFYSPLQKALLNYKKPTETANQFLKNLEKDPAVKREMEATEFDKFITSKGDDSVKLIDLQEYLATNRYKLNIESSADPANKFGFNPYDRSMLIVQKVEDDMPFEQAVERGTEDDPSFMALVRDPDYQKRFLKNNKNYTESDFLKLEEEIDVPYEYRDPSDPFAFNMLEDIRRQAMSDAQQRQFGRVVPDLGAYGFYTLGGDIRKIQAINAAKATDKFKAERERLDSILLDRYGGRVSKEDINDINNEDLIEERLDLYEKESPGLYEAELESLRKLRAYNEYLEPENYKEFLIRADVNKPLDYDHYSSKHFSSFLKDKDGTEIIDKNKSAKNVIGFVRTADYDNITIPNFKGNAKIKMIEELQSDLSSDLRFAKGRDGKGGSTSLDKQTKELESKAMNLEKEVIDKTKNINSLEKVVKNEEELSRLAIQLNRPISEAKEILEINIEKLNNELEPKNFALSKMNALLSALERTIVPPKQFDIYKNPKAWGKPLIEKTLIEAAKDNSDIIALPTRRIIEQRYIGATAAKSVLKAYDKDFKNILESFAKKYNTEIETFSMGDIDLFYYVRLTSKMKEDIKKGRPMFYTGGKV